MLQLVDRKLTGYLQIRMVVTRRNFFKRLNYFVNLFYVNKKMISEKQYSLGILM